MALFCIFYLNTTISNYVGIAYCRSVGVNMVKITPSCSEAEIERSVQCRDGLSLNRQVEQWQHVSAYDCFNLLPYLKEFAPFSLQLANIEKCLPTNANTQLVIYLWQNFVCCHIPHICHEHHEQRSCKFFLAGVNFYRFNAKNWHFRQILREKVAFFTDLTRKIGFFWCKFYSPKILLV